MRRTFGNLVVGGSPAPWDLAHRGNRQNCPSLYYNDCCVLETYCGTYRTVGQSMVIRVTINRMLLYGRPGGENKLRKLNGWTANCSHVSVRIDCIDVCVDWSIVQDDEVKKAP
jgi:hypothetical protein